MINLSNKIINFLKIVKSKFKNKENLISNHKKFINYYSYILFLPNSLTGKIELTEKEHNIYLKAISSFKKSIEELKKSKKYQIYVGKDWETWTRKAKYNLAKFDSEKIFSTLGLRSYKTLELNEYSEESLKLIREEEEYLIDLILSKSNYNLNQFKPYTCLNFPVMPIRNKSCETYFINLINSKYIEDSIYIKENILTFDSPKILEIGGGDGFHCKNLVNLFPNCKYLIFDLPEVAFRSFSFLSCHFEGSKKIGSILDFYNFDMNIKEFIQAFDIIILPCWHIEKFCNSSIEYDCAINCHSFGEMPKNISRKYVSYIDNSCKAFYGINREFGFKHKNLGKDLSLTESSLDEYIKFKNLYLSKSDYPISSNPLYFHKDKKPSYLRSIYKVK